VIDKDADWEVELARNLMIEFVVGEPAKELPRLGSRSSGMLVWIY